MVATPELWHICESARVTGLTLAAEVGLDATLEADAVVHADSIECLGNSTNSDIITDGTTLPLGVSRGGTRYASADYTILIDVAHSDMDVNNAFILAHGDTSNALNGITVQTSNDTGFPVAVIASTDSYEPLLSSFVDYVAGDRYRIVIRYVASSQVLTLFVLDSAGALLSQDDTTPLASPLSWDTAGSTKLWHTNASDWTLRGHLYQQAYWLSALSDAEILADPLAAIELDATDVSNAGGTRLDLYTDRLENGQYLVFIGPNGDTTDTPAYPITRGNGLVVEVLDGYFSVVTPALPIGGPYFMTFHAASANAGSKISNEFVTVVPRCYPSSTFSLRRLVFRNADSGAHNLSEVPYPQV